MLMKTLRTLAFFFASSSVVAGTLTISPANFPGTYTYLDDPESFLFEIQGGPINNPNETYVFGIDGFWSGSIQFVMRELAPTPGTLGLDEVFAIGNLRHTFNPHAGESLPGGGIDFALTLSAFDLPGPGQTGTDSADALVLHPGLPKPHKDLFTALLSATQSSVVPSQIDRWSFRLEAKHVPEPSTLSLAPAVGVGLLLSCMPGWQRRRRARKARG